MPLFQGRKTEKRNLFRLQKSFISFYIAIENFYKRHQSWNEFHFILARRFSYLASAKCEIKTNYARGIRFKVDRVVEAALSSPFSRFSRDTFPFLLLETGWRPVIFFSTATADPILTLNYTLMGEHPSAGSPGRSSNLSRLLKSHRADPRNEGSPRQPSDDGTFLVK